MKSIIQSVSPHICANIISGECTMLLSKTTPNYGLQELLGHFSNRQSELKKYPFDSEEETRGSYNENAKNIELIKNYSQKYGVEVDDDK